MKCPYCGSEETKVLDSRTDETSSKRRRRECIACKRRFTTFERFEIDLTVIGRDGKKTPFSVDKLKDAIAKACEKRLEADAIEKIVEEVESELAVEGKPEIQSTEIGEKVMARLKKLDKIAFLRYALAYHPPADLGELEKEVHILKMDAVAPDHEIRRIRKRDGRVVPYDRDRITNAIFKAAQAVGGKDRDLAIELAKQVEAILSKQFKPHEIPTVEEIQDIVEKVLIENGHFKTAKAYILYRKQRADLRNISAMLASVGTVEEYLMRSDWRVTENANMGYSLQGLNNYVSAKIIANYWLEKIYPAAAAQAHRNGLLHLHDLNTLGSYCVGWDLLDLLVTGFGHVEGKVNSRPPKHFRTALGQIVNFIYTLQGESAGAQALSSFDTYLAPFIRADRLSYDQVKQAMQEFLFNMAVPTRVGFQSLAFDEPIVLKRNGAIRIESIGAVVEKEFRDHAGCEICNVDGYGNPSPDSLFMPATSECYAIGFDSDGNAKWLKVKGFVKHLVKNKKFKKIRTGRGETIVSPAHSLFKLSKFKFTPVEAQSLETTKPNEKIKENNHVVALRSASHLFGNSEELDLIEALKEMPSPFFRNIFVVLTPTAFEALEKNILRIKTLKQFFFDCKRDKSCWTEWKQKGSVPLDVWLEYGEHSDKMIQLRLRNEAASVPRILKGTELEQFIQLIGWYLSEGKALKTNVVVSQATEAQENIEEISNCLVALNQSFNTSISHGWSSKTREQTTTKVTNFIVNGFYSHVVKHVCGVVSENKSIPSFVLNLSPHFRRLLLETIVKGDGYEAVNCVGVYTKSRKLLSQIALLLSSLDLDYSINRKDLHTNCYALYYFPNGRKEKREIALGNFEAVSVYEVTDYDYDHDWEYDISVEEQTENFVGGSGMLSFHNTPFSNITLDLKVPKHVANEPAIVGGQPADFAYGDLQEEMDLFNTAFAEVTTEGDADGRVFTFPIPTYNITRDFDWESPVSMKIFELTAKYGVPYFANYVNSDMKPEDARSMCCRLKIDNRELHKRGGGLFGANPLTGSVGVVTLNLPRLAFDAKNEDVFFEKLLELMLIARDSLEAKRKAIEKFTEEGLYPYSKFYLRSIKQLSGGYWKNHFSTIGIVGMNEALLNMFGINIATPEGQAFALKTLDFMREHITRFQQETGSLYNLEATPAEGTSYRLARIDKKRTPEIIVANNEAVKQGAEPFYTNSTQLPVDYTDDVFEALELQDELQSKYTGGTVLHCFLGERLHDPRTAAELVKKIFSMHKLPYLSITPTFSICNRHGYIEGEHFYCPKCDEEIGWTKAVQAAEIAAKRSSNK